MKNILSVLLSFIVALATAQTNNPKSFTELAATGSTVQKENAPSSKNLKSVNVSAAAPAGITYYTDRAIFDNDFPGLPIEGFENGNIAPNSVGVAYGTLNENTNNSFFSPGDILPGIEIVSSLGPSEDLAYLGVGFLGATSKIVVPNTFTDACVINFSPAVQGVGLDVVDLDQVTPVTIEIYDANSNLLASTSSASSVAGVFWGVSSDTPIAQIIINSTTGSGEGADNIAFGNAATLVPVSDWAIYLVFFLIIASTVFRFRKSIFKNAEFN